jgi:hypothetical protein
MQHALALYPGTAGVPLKPAAGFTTPSGCPMFAPAYVGRKRWAKPQQLFVPNFTFYQRCHRIWFASKGTATAGL